MDLCSNSLKGSPFDHTIVALFIFFFSKGIQIGFALTLLGESISIPFSMRAIFAFPQKQPPRYKQTQALAVHFK